MVDNPASKQIGHAQKRVLNPDHLLVTLSIILQVALGLFFGHVYDMRIFMATGYLVGTGQDPYIAQNLSAVFHNSSFQGITSVGYPPPWPLILGLIYLITYRINSNLILYNLAIKIPIIAANGCLAYLVAHILSKMSVGEKVAHKAWIFLLFNPFVLYVSSAWGMFDSIVAFLSLLALVYLSEGKMAGSAILLALAIAFKPTALPLIAAVLVFRRGRPIQGTLRYFFIFLASSVILWVGPFLLFRWDSTPILQHWDAQFTVGGGLSYMTFLELVQNSYQLYGLWSWLGFLWVPAVGLAAFALKPGGEGLLDLMKKSTALIMVFFLSRAWLSETNLMLVLPLLLILTSVGELDRRLLNAIWVLALVFSFFNTSTFQLLFPSLPGLMDRLLQLSDVFRAARLAVRIIVVIPWQIAGIRIILQCYRQRPIGSQRIVA